MSKKSILAIGVVGFLLVTLVGCGTTSDNPTDQVFEEVTDEYTAEQDTLTQEEQASVEAEAKSKAEEQNNNNVSSTLDAYTIMVYYSNDNADGLNSKEVTIDSLDSLNIMRALYEAGVFAVPVDVLNFTVPADSSNQPLILDVSEDFQAQLQQMGTSGEGLFLGAVVNTFLDAYGANAILITVEGNVLESGHAEYAEPLTWFEFENYVTTHSYSQ